MAPTDMDSFDRDAVTFASPITNLRIVRANELQRPSPFGGSVEKVSPGLRYEFQDGFLVVDKKLRARDKRFFEKYADVDDDLQDTRPAEEWLRDHHLFQVEKGFVEVQQAVPASAPVLLEITNALLAEDVERLVEIHEAEESSYRREDVLEAVRGSLLKLEQPSRSLGAR